LRCREMEREVP
jgi:hypothetical protein